MLPLASDDALPTLLRVQQQISKLANQCRTNHQGLIDAEAERKRNEADRIERARKSLDKKP